MRSERRLTKNKIVAYTNSSHSTSCLCNFLEKRLLSTKEWPTPVVGCIITGYLILNRVIEYSSVVENDRSETYLKKLKVLKKIVQTNSEKNEKTNHIANVDKIRKK